MSLKSCTLNLTRKLFGAPSITRLATRNFLNNSVGVRIIYKRFYSENLKSYRKFDNLFKYLQKSSFNWSILTEKGAFNSENDGILLLLESCAKSNLDKSPRARLEIIDEIWKNLVLDDAKLNVEHYNSYLRACLENGKDLDVDSFLSSMKVRPSTETYKLLLEMVCESGNISQALSLLSTMRNEKISVDEQIFNSLVLCHTIHGGLVEGEDVIRTMKLAQIEENEETNWCLLRGLAKRKDKNEFLKVLEKKPLQFDEKHFFKLLSIFTQNNIEDWLTLLKRCLDIPAISREYLPKLEDFCKILINEDNCESAINIYYFLVPPEYNNQEYGLFLLKEMLNDDKPEEAILNAAKDLNDRELNTLALEQITEFAFAKKNFDITWAFLENFNQLRPHYFWPLLVASGKNGEIDVLATLQRMIDLKVVPDAETLESYCLPFCDLSRPSELILKLKKMGFTLKQLVPQLVTVLLQNGNIRNALIAYEGHPVPINDSRIYVILAKSWAKTFDAKHAVLLLQRMCESGLQSYDPVGTFVIRSFKSSRITKNLDNFLKLLQEIKITNLKIANTSSDELFSLLRKAQHYKNIPKLEKAIEEITDIALRNDKSHIPHPKDMNVDELECHLTELESKDMDTRGVIRKLILEHARLKNVERVKELRKKFAESGFEESPGMLSSLLHTYIMAGSLNVAHHLYEELKSNHPSFLLDDFKILDLVRLMVEEGKFDDALKILLTESQNRTVNNPESIERNCVQLLHASKSSEDVNTLLDILLKYNYCKPKNVVLGAIIRKYIVENKIEDAVLKYCEFAEKHRCTPLQLELLFEVVTEENRHLLEKVLEATTRVHGSKASISALIAALAETGLTQPLRKLLMDVSGMPLNYLELRYKRWVQEDKIQPFLTLLEASEGLPTKLVNAEDIYSSIMGIYSLRNDCDSANELWRRLEERNISPSKQLHDEYFSLLKRCKYQKAQQIK